MNQQTGQTPPATPPIPVDYSANPVHPHVAHYGSIDAASGPMKLSISTASLGTSLDLGNLHVSSDHFNY
jgi:hypothetical protein